jgi:hypothetical protein
LLARHCERSETRRLRRSQPIFIPYSENKTTLVTMKGNTNANLISLLIMNIKSCNKVIDFCTLLATKVVCWKIR